MIEKINRPEIGNVANQDYSGMRLEDINGHKKTFENCNFSASYIARGYFRETKFINCKFIGSRISIKEGALKNQVQHFSERMLHGKTLQTVEY